MTESPPPPVQGPPLAVFERRARKTWPWWLAGAVLVAGGAAAAVVVVTSGSAPSAISTEPEAAPSRAGSAAATSGAASARERTGADPSASAPETSASARLAPETSASTSAPPAPPPPPAAAPPATDARPDEAAAVFRDRVVQPLAVMRFTDALEGLEAAVALDRDLRSCANRDEALFHLVVQGFAMDAETVARLTRLLTKDMGPVGVDVLFEVMVRRGGSKAAARATELLTDEALRARGTPALRIAYDLRQARACADRKALVERVGTDGDARALRELDLVVTECADIGLDPTYRAARKAALERVGAR
ncbi:MAG: hypothetical protein IT373_09685 [Polyangiaceae bacterium]|nr:hypothetical protein [Polyangiaceae bacterium]